MKKRNKIIYWVATIWLALGMAVTGIGQLLNVQTGPGSVEMIQHLHYPLYLLNLLGVLKIMGTVVILIAGAKLLKEWAYAGFFFLMVGAVGSHLFMGDPISKLLPALLLFVLTLISWYFRPESRSLITQSPQPQP